MPVVVAAISGMSGSGGFAVSSDHPVEAVVEGAEVGVVLLLGTERGRRRAVVLVTADVEGAGAVVDGGAGSVAAPASRPHAANVSTAHPAIATLRDTTHRSFLLLLRLLTVAVGGPEEGVPEHDRIGSAGWPPVPPGAIERRREATDRPVERGRRGSQAA